MFFAGRTLGGRGVEGTRGDMALVVVVLYFKSTEWLLLAVLPFLGFSVLPYSLPNRWYPLVLCHSA